ncbi:hypothetical protein DEO72_LG11g2294 [Vigna unguiculata]|uniref:Uncharacterized protein n=1 Tax=Vigna unguiculata TaxID=3917 RepID=A0A4D6NSP3_VIGUN|nr:hypothetical protein DEO72_LG11g2294 [Vigna unguiculata]
MIRHKGTKLTWRLAARLVPPSGLGRFRLTAFRLRQAVHGWWLTCDDMSREVHIQLLSCGDTSESRTMSGEVRRVELRAGRFVEAEPRAGSSPFLFVYGGDRLICYTGADVDTGDAEDAQVTE